MKKLIAISVVFALIAGTAFAADIAVDVAGNVKVVQGSTGGYHEVEEPDPSGTGTIKTREKDAATAGGQWARIRISASGENDEGTFGAWFRYDSLPPYEGNKTGWDESVEHAQAHAWWKPVEQVRLLFGGGPDGRFEQSGVTRWGFYQVAGDTRAVPEGFKFSDSFYQGWEDAGLNLTVTPMEAFEINLGIPFITQSQSGAGKDGLKHEYMKSHLQFAYTADGIGTFAFTYKANTSYLKGSAKVWEYAKLDPTTLYDSSEFSKIFLYAGLTMIENLGIDFGLAYTLPVKYNEDYSSSVTADPTKPGSIDVPAVEGSSLNPPIAIGLGAKYTAGDFGVKARTQVKLAGKYVASDGADAYKIPMNIIFDVLPSYNISESMIFLFSAGVDYTFKSGNDSDKDADDNYARMGWHIHPYLAIKSSWWAPNLFIGLRLATDGEKYKDDGATNSKGGAANINWSVPIGIIFSY